MANSRIDRYGILSILLTV